MSAVLLVGQDEMLQFTRAALLRTLGVETVCSDASDAVGMLRDRQFDLIVLCHSLPAKLSESLVQKIHASWPNTRVLRITMRAWEVPNTATSGDVVTSADPATLIQQARSLLQRGPGPGPATWGDQQRSA